MPTLFREPWARNAAAITTGMFATFFGYSFFVPFLALYYQEFGLTPTESAAWAGFTGLAQGLGFAISAPLWGMLADRIGRKPMVVRAMFASSAGIAVIPFFDSPLAVLLLILGRGFLAGPGTASMALVSAQTPPRQLARVIGWLEGAQVLGLSIGLAIGAVMAALIGISNTFLAGGGLGLLGSVVVLVFVREDFQRPERYQPAVGQGLLQRLGGGLRQARATVNPTIMFSFLLMGGVWMSQQGAGYILPLRIQQLTDPGLVALYAGLIQSAFSVTTFLGVVLAARSGQRLGYRRTFFIGLILVMALYVPQGLSSSLPVIAATRTIQGLFTGLMMPLARALVSFASDPEDRGTVYGLSGVVGGLGTATGPLIISTILVGAIGIGPAIAMVAICFIPAFSSLIFRREIDAIAAAQR